MNHLQEMIKYGSAEIKPNLASNEWSETVVVVVGCGGTGSRLIPLIAQHIANHNTTLKENPRHNEYTKSRIHLVLVDPDVVELKNLKRQNFIKSDIGRNKAEVMAERYSVIYSMDIEYNDGYFSMDTLNRTRYTSNNISNIIFFDCTDNLKARKSIEEVYQKSTGYNCILISGGNEDSFGQCLIACRSSYSSDTNILLNNIKYLDEAIKEENPKNKLSYNFLPTLLKLYPDFKDTETQSCTDMVLQNDQSMPINTLVATLMYNAFYTIISGSTLNYNLVKCSINNVFSTKTISHPKVLIELYARAVCGYSNAVDTVLDWIPISNYTKINSLIDFMNKHKEKSINLVSNFISSYSWRINNNDMEHINKLIKEFRGD